MTEPLSSNPFYVSERELLLKQIDDGCGCETSRQVRRMLEELDRLRAHRCDLPDSIKEALNSGDGIYRP